MKRHRQLQQLSREHYTALKVARDAKLAAAGDRDQVSQGVHMVVKYFEDELDPHFKDEEASVLPLLARHGKQALAERTLAEHEEFRRLARTIGDTDREALLRFAQLLVDHVRFEERELFEVAQGFLP